MKVEGLEQLTRDLIAAGKVDPKEIKAIVTGAGQRIINAARRNASFSGTLAGSIGYISKNAANYPTSVLIGPQYPAGALAHIYEYGTAPRFTRRGARRGQIVARPFMRPAFDSNRDSVAREIRVNVLKLIEKKAKQNNLK